MVGADDTYGFRGQCALVVGASSGIGFSVASQLINHGASVCCLGRTQSSLDAATAALSAGTHSVIADLNDPATLAPAVAAAVEKLGGLDIVVISAGNGGSEYLGTDVDSPASYDFLNRVHVQSTMEIVKAAQPHLAQTSGCVVAVTSLASEVVWPQTVPYNCAKAAQHTLLKNLALQHVGAGIRVNAVLPACIHTSALDKMAAIKGVTADVYASKRARAHPMKRCGDPSDVASAVLFLASRKMSSFITGAMLNVDGGLSLTNWFNTNEMLTVGPEDA